MNRAEARRRAHEDRGKRIYPLAHAAPYDRRYSQFTERWVPQTIWQMLCQSFGSPDKTREAVRQANVMGTIVIRKKGRLSGKMIPINGVDWIQAVQAGAVAFKIQKSNINERTVSEINAFLGQP